MSFVKLVEGFRGFQSDYFTGDSELFQKLVMEGQSPEALVIACSDSRIDPGIVTRAEPGDIFSVRNVAALVPPYTADGRLHGTSAAIEYAVSVLKVKDVIIMGHALCGGIRALTESNGDIDHKKDFVSRWISIGSKARDLVHKYLPDSSVEEQARVLEQTAILASLKNLMTFPSVKAAVEEGRLQLHGWYFDMPNGKVLGYDPETLKFKNILSGHNIPAIGTCDGACSCDSKSISLSNFVKRVKKDKEMSATSPISPAAQTRKAKLAEHVKQMTYAATATAATASEKLLPLIETIG